MTAGGVRSCARMPGPIKGRLRDVDQQSGCYRLKYLFGTPCQPVLEFDLSDLAHVTNAALMAFDFEASGEAVAQLFDHVLKRAPG